MDILGIGKVADAFKAGEYIAAAFGFLAWCVSHPSTGAYIVGAILMLAVFHKSWPTANVPDINTGLGRMIVGLACFLIALGFTWRVADEIINAVPSRLMPTPHARPEPKPDQILTPYKPPLQDYQKKPPSDGG